MAQNPFLPHLKALAFDPYVEDTGITEDDIPDILLSRAKLPVKQLNYWGTSSKHKVREKDLGLPSLIKNEVWYLETGTGHQWMAQKLPKR